MLEASLGRGFSARQSQCWLNGYSGWKRTDANAQLEAPRSWRSWTGPSVESLSHTTRGVVAGKRFGGQLATTALSPIRFSSPASISISKPCRREGDASRSISGMPLGMAGIIRRCGTDESRELRGAQGKSNSGVNPLLAGRSTVVCEGSRRDGRPTVRPNPWRITTTRRSRGPLFE